MSKFLFVTWDGGGNQPPMAAIACRLRERGHKVRVAGYDSQQPLFTDMDIEFAGLNRSRRWRRLAEDPAGVLTGVFGNPEHPADISDAASEFDPDLMVVDCLMFGALAGAEALRLPTATLVHSGPRALGAGPLGAVVIDGVNAIRVAAGLASVATIHDAWKRFPCLATSFAELDGGELDGFEFVGPILDDRPGEWQSPWPGSDSRPLVLISLSTARDAFGNQAERYQAIMDACAEMPVRILLTTGGGVDQAALRPPVNTVVVGFVSHALMLDHAAACVTHAGHGTVCAALRAGVPLVCMPNPRADQPFLARRVAELGAGRHLSQDAIAVDIRGALNDVLENPSYARSANALGAAIRRTPGVDGAATRLEAMVGVVAH